MKCNHNEVNKIKGKEKLWRCSKCGELIIKGKKTPDRAYGKQDR